MHSFSRIAIALVLLEGCATRPPALPPDYGSVAPSDRLDASRFQAKDLSLDCAGIDRELAENKRQRDEIEAKIKQDHHGNQVIGYFSGFIPPLIAAAKMNLAEKERYQALYKRRDQLTALRRYRSCS